MDSVLHRIPRRARTGVGRNKGNMKRLNSSRGHQIWRQALVLAWLIPLLARPCAGAVLTVPAPPANRFGLYSFPFLGNTGQSLNSVLPAPETGDGTCMY